MHFKIYFKKYILIESRLGGDTPKAGAARQVHVVRKEQVDRGRYQKSTSERRRESEWSR